MKLMSERDAIRDRLIKAAQKVVTARYGSRGVELDAEAELAAASKALDEWVEETVGEAALEGHLSPELTSGEIVNAILKREVGVAKAK